MSHGLFIRHQARPGRRLELVEVWERFMPAAISANPGHEAYVYTEVADDPDAVMVYQQYTDAGEAAAFLEDTAYLAYLHASEHLLAGPPVVTVVAPRWSKRVG